MDNSSAVNVARSGEDDDAHRRWAVGTAAGGAKASVAAGRAAASVMAAVRDFMVASVRCYYWMLCQDRKWEVAEADSDFFTSTWSWKLLEAKFRTGADWRQNSGQRSGIYHLSLRNVGDDNLNE